MFTWTDDPYRALWDHLQFLSHEANVRQLLTGRMASGRPFGYLENQTVEKKSRQIARSVQQAHEYYMAADTVSLATSPVLYFYGMLALAKALVVANATNKYLEDINYHGLHTRPRSTALKTYAQDAAAWEIEKEFAVVRGGVFPELTEVTIGLMT